MRKINSKDKKNKSRSVKSPKVVDSDENASDSESSEETPKKMAADKNGDGPSNGATNDNDYSDSDTEVLSKSKRKTGTKTKKRKASTDSAAKKKDKSSKKRKSVTIVAPSESEGESDDGSKIKAESDDEVLEKKRSSKSKANESDDVKSKNIAKEKVEDSDEDEDEEDYEVEEIIDHKWKGGKKYYLIRWKGYTADDDTWEPESTLSCSELIDQFLSENDELPKSKSDKSSKKKKSIGKNEKKKSAKKEKPKNSHKKKETVTDGEDDEVEDGKEWEVKRILDVHFRRDGSREFLIHWKGFTESDNTWEPEENIDCPNLVDRFMEKLDNLKVGGPKELRENRQTTQRFSLMASNSGRRLSKRHQGKQRSFYYDAE